MHKQEVDEEFFNTMLEGAEGAIPINTNVEKINSEEGDQVIDGTKGVICGSVKGPEDYIDSIGREIKYGYLVQWNIEESGIGLTQPYFVVDFKVKEV